ncbi:MAG: hypothetical protein ACXAC6_02740 [Candidatus Hodarchaeales archaeon]|jgi:hypothetical protein
MFVTKIIRNEFKDRVSIISLCVSVVAFLVIILTLSGTTLPILSDSGSAFLVLWVLGFSMSALSGARDNSGGEFTLPKQVWLPLSILGALSFVLLAMVIFNISFLMMDDNTDRFLLLSLIIISKWLYMHLYNTYKLYKSEEEVTSS